MNVFKKRIAEFAKNQKTYEASDLQVIINNGVIGIYEKKTRNDGYSLKSYEAVIRASNVMDKSDFIDYRLMALPGGRAAFGGYLYPENLDRSKISLYKFCKFWYSIFGEEISYDRRFTIDELKGFLQIFKSRMEQSKYECLYELRYKDSFEGKRDFEGSKYFAGITNGDFENIKCGDAFNIQELRDVFIKGDLSDSPFELIDLCTVRKRSRLYDEPYFTKDAFCKIVEEIEKKRGKSK